MERVLCFFALLLAEVVYLKIALKIKIVDVPNIRSSHKQSTVRGGGIIFLLAVLLFTAFYSGGYPFFIVGMVLIAFTSFWDDIHSLSPKLRFLIQILSIFLMFEEVGMYALPFVWLIPVTILAVYVLNVYNFMDGVNGMTGMYSLVVLFSFWLLNRQNIYINGFLMELLVMAIIIFGFFNFRNNAVCFAGDVGSVGLGYCILFILLKIIIATHELTYSILGIVYAVDVTLTLIHRISLHENILQPHRKYLFQLLANEGHLPHLIVAMLYALTQLIISLGLIYLPINKWVYSGLVVAILATIYVVLVKKLFPKHLEYLRQQSSTALLQK